MDRQAWCCVRGRLDQQGRSEHQPAPQKGDATQHPTSEGAKDWRSVMTSLLFNAASPRWRRTRSRCFCTLARCFSSLQRPVQLSAPHPAVQAHPADDSCCRGARPCSTAGPAIECTSNAVNAPARLVQAQLRAMPKGQSPCPLDRSITECKLHELLLQAQGHLGRQPWLNNSTLHPSARYAQAYTAPARLHSF